MARVSALFEEALTLPGHAREAWLHELEADDSALASELRSLLSAHHAAGDFIGDAMIESPGALLDDDAAPGSQAGPGVRVGPYCIERELARGGMGVVYVARRADGQFDQRVALKLVRRGLDSEAMRAHFLTERQLLARLNHPHIARLLDGGITRDGQPWFAMEFVEGRPLHEHCRATGCDLSARLDLFLQVCEAVRHAHGKLIVHRDLKPGNILVTADGTPKLLDFGIAKLIDLEDEGAQSRLTRLGYRPLTPEYAAPEQMRGEPVTTAVDVYALGVILYELLTGQLPLRPDPNDPLAAAHTVCETLPPRPSSTLGEQPALARSVRGDLDAIAMQALRKEPARRYASVDRLAEDVRRYRTGLPVAARPDTVGYRAGKFLRRHRLGVAAATAMLALLVGGLAATAWQARIAASERDRARQEATKAQQVKELIVGLFEQADPSVSASGDVTVRELLDSGVEQVRSDLATQPDVQAELLNTIGVSYRALGRYEEAKIQLRDALELRRAILPAVDQDLATTLNDLANVHHYLGDYDRAGNLYGEALTMRRSLFGDLHPAVAETINDLGILRYQQGDGRGALPLYREALEIRLATLGGMHQHTLTSEHNLGGLLFSLAQYDDARAIMAANVDKWRELHGGDHTDLADALNLLARIVLRMGDFSAAELHFDESLAIRRAMLPAEHPAIASSLNSIAALKSDLGEFAQAESLMRETLAMDRALLGPEHPYVAGDLQRLADAIGRQARYDEAISLFAEALALARKVREPEHPSTASCLRDYATTLARAGRAAEALPMADEALAIYASRFGTEHADYARALAARAMVRHRAGAHDEAASDYQEALALQRSQLGDRHPDVARTLSGLAAIDAATGDAAAARERLAEALSILQVALPAGHWRIRDTENRFAALSRGDAVPSGESGRR